MMIIRTVDAIEDGLLKIWQDEEFLRGYHAKRDPRQRIDSLVGRFHGCGIEVNPQVIGEFLGLRYLRNMMVHARLKDHERSHLEDLGFPLNIDMLGAAFLARTVQIASELDDYIARATSGTFVKGDPRPVWTSDLSLALNSVSDSTDWVRYLLRPNQLARAWWHNLEAIGWWLEDQVSPQTEVVGYVADLALESWRELVQASGLSKESVEQASKVLMELHQRQAYAVVPLGFRIERLGELKDVSTSHEFQQQLAEKRRLLEPVLSALMEAQSLGFEVKGQIWEDSVPTRVAVALLRVAVPECAPIIAEDVLDALRVGARAYKLIPNIAPLEVFRLLIALAVPRSNNLRAAGDEALLFCKLARNWYAYVESIKGSVSTASPSSWAEYEHAFQY
jgi:hypothetical protein